MLANSCSYIPPLITVRVLDVIFCPGLQTLMTYKFYSYTVFIVFVENYILAAGACCLQTIIMQSYSYLLYSY